MKRSKLLVLSALVALPLAGCRDKESPAAMSEAREPEAATAPAPTAQLDASDAASQIPVQRKLIQNAELHVEVTSYEAARSELDALLAEHGGFVADAQVTHVDGEVSRALKVTAQKFTGSAKAKLEKAGGQAIVG